MSQEMGIKLQAISFFSSVQTWPRGFMNAEFLKKHSNTSEYLLKGQSRDSYVTHCLHLKGANGVQP